MAFCLAQCAPIVISQCIFYRAAKANEFAPFMQTAFLKDMENVLLVELDKLRKELDRLSQKGGTSRDAFDADYETLGDKEDENADKVAALSDNLSLESELSTALRDVESALGAIKNGSYGVCKYCKQLISEERLRARPTSTSCVACKKTLTQEM